MQASNGKVVMVQGRIIWAVGDLFKGNIKTQFGTQTPILNQQGEQVREYGFGLAVPKASCAEIWNALHEEAYTLFPTRQIPPAFSMKYKDGDTAVDDKGNPYSTREGYAGNLVLSCKTQMPIKWFKWENGNNILVNEGIKCGDYVQVQLSVKAHPAVGQGKAGLYLNPYAVLFLGYGKEIVNTPSGNQIFGTQAPVMPQGASAVPVAPNGSMPLVTTGIVQQPAMSAPIPHHAVLPPQFQPQATAMPQMPQIPR